MRIAKLKANLLHQECRILIWFVVDHNLLLLYRRSSVEVCVGDCLCVFGTAYLFFSFLTFDLTICPFYPDFYGFFCSYSTPFSAWQCWLSFLVVKFPIGRTNDSKLSHLSLCAHASYSSCCRPTPHNCDSLLFCPPYFFPCGFFPFGFFPFHFSPSARKLFLSSLPDMPVSDLLHHSPVAWLLWLFV